MAPPTSQTVNTEKSLKSLFNHYAGRLSIAESNKQIGYITHILISCVGYHINLAGWQIHCIIVPTVRVTFTHEGLSDVSVVHVGRSGRPCKRNIRRGFKTWKLLLLSWAEKCEAALIASFFVNLRHLVQYWILEVYSSIQSMQFRDLSSPFILSSNSNFRSEVYYTNFVRVISQVNYFVPISQNRGQWTIMLTGLSNLIIY